MPVLAALYAFATIMLGFAHQPVAAAQAVGPDLSAYVLPDGTAPILCSELGGVDHGARHGVSHPCEACALTAAAGLICAPPAVFHAAEFVVLAHARTAQAQFAPAVLPAPTSRGPPSART
ncbi:MAG: hypothetical protein KGM42_01270 [Hyphomicrobiales bacterium]|nr:hypothetical protein [Hyphomicrobiales bacterium]